LTTGSNTYSGPPGYVQTKAAARAPSKGGAVRAAVIVALLLFTTPFWLPPIFGGQALYQYVVSDSMTGAVDRGSLVIVLPQESYALGDVVAFNLDFGNNVRVPILHRVMGRNNSGQYLIKGDAAPGTDSVNPKDVLGKMVVGIPFLGFVGGASKVFPLSIAFVVLAPMVVGRGKKQETQGKPSSLFFPVALIVLAAIPLASIGIAGTLGKPVAAFLLIGSLTTARFAEMAYRKELGTMTEVLYIMVGMAAFSMVYIPDVLQAAKSLLGI